MSNRLKQWPVGLRSNTFLELFRPVALSEKVRRIASGLKEPKESGAYKYAIGELRHLQSWLCAVTIPVLSLWLFLLLAAPLYKAATDGPIVRLRPTPPDQPILDPPPPPPRDIDPLPIKETSVLMGSLIAEPADTMPAAMDPTPPVQNALPPESLIKSPLRFALPIQREGLGRRSDHIAGRGDGPGENAVIRALRWLKSKQRTDGAWESPEPAMTGLAILCFLGHGELPGRSEEFGATVQLGLEWLLKNQQADGLFKGRDTHDYSLPICVYALSEAAAMTRNPQVREAAERSLAVIVRGQNAQGGWGYNCVPGTRIDTSYSGWCVQALKAAHLAGLRNEGLDAGMRRAVTGLAGNAHPNGGFGYTSPGQGGLTGVGVLSLQFLGKSDTDEVKRGLHWMERMTCAWQKPWGGRPLYYWYYATQAKFYAGGPGWDSWDRLFAAELTANQQLVESEAPEGKPMGFWQSPAASESYGDVYSTTLCTLMLEVYYRYLPSYEVLAGKEVKKPVFDEPEQIASILFPDA